MTFRIFKEVQFDASHRLLHYRGKCNFLHGHRWKVEVWMEGQAGERTGMVADFNTIKDLICRFDHQIILNSEDPMADAIRASTRSSPHRGNQRVKTSRLFLRG